MTVSDAVHGRTLADRTLVAADSTSPPDDHWTEGSLVGVARQDSPIGYGIVQPGPYVRGGVPVIAIRDLPIPSMRSVHRSAQEIEAAYRRSRVRGGDILISVKGTTGRVGIVPKGFEGNISRDVARVRLTDEHHPGFWHQMLQSTGPQQLLQLAAVGSTRQELSIGTLRQVRFAYPSKAAQQRISDVLTDFDQRIAVVERSIIKKQAIQQGMMQQLLTGATRLPGFTEPWVELRLRDVLTVRHGKSQKTVESASGKYPILATGGQIGWADTALYTKPSVLIGRKGTIDRPQYQDTPFWTVDTLFYTEITSAADPRYFYYVFLTVDWRSMNEASGVPSLSSTRVESVGIKLPSIAEQRAIRSVLDDADADLVALRARLDKFKAIKLGVTQQLLTGSARLPVAEAVA